MLACFLARRIATALYSPPLEIALILSRNPKLGLGATWIALIAFGKDKNRSLGLPRRRIVILALMIY